jgi:thiamine-monophosphate kinase
VRISDIGGENAVIKLIADKYAARAGGDLVLGIGDDAALLRGGQSLLVVTTDLLVENTHFRMDINEPYLLGWKSAAVNISDIAAMGGVPSYAFVSIGLPDVGVSVVEDIYRGLSDCCSAYGCAIAGGDTVGSACGIVINVTVLGQVEPDLAARRSAAKPGDVILVTNTLGDSRAGLELLLKRGLPRSREVSPYLVERHLKPKPRVSEARAAVRTGKVHAMMDLSDGLSMDLIRLCAASGVGARVYLDSLPASDDLARVALSLDADPKLLAASGGEDYELLLTCAKSDADTVIAALGAATVIGEIIDGDAVRLVHSTGDETAMPKSWQHFSIDD